MSKKLTLLVLSLCMLAGGEERSDFAYVHPKPGAEHVAVENHILFRLNQIPPQYLLNIEQCIRVTGRTVGSVKGKISIAADERTLVFSPESTLALDEIYDVYISPETAPHQGRKVAAFSFHFKTVATTIHIPEPPLQASTSAMISNGSRLAKSAAAARIMPNGVSVPGDFPHINVRTNKQTADGSIFINNWRNESPYNIIFRNDGSPVWYERQADGDRRRDFKVQKNGAITMLTRHGGQRFLGYDNNFNLINEYRATAGYGTDEHELQVLQDGSYFLIGVRGVHVDMSTKIDGGDPNANVTETTIQGYSAAHELIFNWPALEHLNPADIIGWCDPGQADPRARSFRFPHMNAIDIDDDGHILLSSRHLSEVTKINRDTGEIIWRLGGANSDFTFVNDQLGGFYMQHDIRSLGNNHYTVFDNGNLHEPAQSRAVEYVLDVTNKTAMLVSEFRGPEGRNFYTHYMGNNQRMPNGNSFINWVTGGNPKAMEVTPDGEVVYEMNFVDGYDTYRTFRFPWDGVVPAPRLYIEQDNNSLVLIFNKFGDENVDYYKIYGDVSPGPTAVVDTSRATMKKVTGLINEQRYYFRVTSVSKDGVESGYSNEVDIFVNFVNPGQNSVRNGDFSAGDAQWIFSTTDAEASADITNDGEMRITVNTPGADFSSIQLWQAGLSLVRGKTYLFEFDAYATVNRTITARIEKNAEPWTNYGKINPTALRRAKQRFAYEFIMQDPSDFNARVIFQCGLFPGDVFIDNVSLTNIDGELPVDDLPHPWQHQDIGGPNLAGDAGIWQDRYFVTGSGRDIWNTADEFHFAYMPIQGDVEISARVVSMSQTNGWAKAGVMIRNTLQPGAKHAFTCATVSNGMAFQRRLETDASSLNTNIEDSQTPYWVKIVRKGNAFFSYESADGETWRRIGTERIEMNRVVYVGFAVTSHDNNQLCEAMFDDLKMVSATQIDDHPMHAPASFALHPASPNPFNPRTTIRYALPQPAKVKLVLYNVRGEQVRELVNKTQEMGHYSIEFHADDVPSGVYLYKLHAEPIQFGLPFLDVQKMTVVK